MKRTIVKYRRSRLGRFLTKHQKYAPVFFFVGGFTFDSLTLGRIDRLYDLTVLCSHMTTLSLTLYLFNRAEDGAWKDTLLGRYQDYLPLAIQFFFGALSSAFVIYFSRSVSLSKTITFFIMLVVLLFANELLKQRISNKYLQFGVYSFISFTFFSFIIPVFLEEMNTAIFILSGILSLGLTLTLIIVIYRNSPSTRAEIGLGKVIGLVATIYLTINTFYYFNMIPPVPLALAEGIVAHKMKVEDNEYTVTYEANEWYAFWRDHRLDFTYLPGETVYVFTSIFAPTDIRKEIAHRWKYYDEETEDWQTVEDISYSINGGRDEGYRGYTAKENVMEGQWKVEVITTEELVIGVIHFDIVLGESRADRRVETKRF